MGENEINLRIEGMTCEGCAATISAYLKREGGWRRWMSATGRKRQKLSMIRVKQTLRKSFGAGYSPVTTPRNSNMDEAKSNEADQEG